MAQGSRCLLGHGRTQVGDDDGRLTTTRYVAAIDSYRILCRTSLQPLRFQLACVVQQYPHTYELLRNDDSADESTLLENSTFLRFHREIVEHELQSAETPNNRVLPVVTTWNPEDRRKTVVHVTPTERPKLRITSDIILDRHGPPIKAEDVVSLVIEARHLLRNRSSYIVSPIHLHVCGSLLEDDDAIT